MNGSRQLIIESGVGQALHGFTLPDEIGFGVIMAPVMYVCQCNDGVWEAGRLKPYGPLQIDPSAKALHYAQEYFEGMKAYRVDNDHATLFRPDQNCARFATSAHRLCMPEVPEELFMEGVSTMTAYCESLIPGKSGQSLYLRPFVIGMQPNLGLGVSQQSLFIVIASPSDTYHAGSMRVLVERHDTRAAVGGTGAVKVGGNYAASLMASNRAKSLGYDQTLWLDPLYRRAIEELSGMNFFAVIDGKLFTPELNGSILPGITRDSLIQIARRQGFEVVENELLIDDVINAISDGRCSEAFACGTAAIVAPISVIGEADGNEYTLPNDPGPVAVALKEELLGIQEGRVDDRFGWVKTVDASWYPTSVEVA